MIRKPKIELKLTTTDKVIEITGWFIILGIWILILYNYYKIPERIPIHYNIFGKADNFGGKANILILPIISTILFIGLTILNKFPHIFNYLETITKENAPSQYTNATRTIRILKLVIAIIFGLIVFQTLHNTNTDNGLGIWFLPFMFGVIFIPLIYFLIKSAKTKNNK
jgi:uncharacterized membrane protein